MQVSFVNFALILLDIVCCKYLHPLKYFAANTTTIFKVSWDSQVESKHHPHVFFLYFLLIILLQFEILPLLFVCDNNLSNHKCLTFKLLKLESIRNLCDIQQPWMACLRLSLWGVVITFGVPRPTPPFNFFHRIDIYCWGKWLQIGIKLHK